jgi:hypothetical protein
MTTIFRRRAGTARSLNRQVNARNKRIERLYYKHFCGKIDATNIDKVYKVGNAFLLEYPDITDDALAEHIVKFVNTIRAAQPRLTQRRPKCEHI